jgi:hypothetical protein
MIKFQDERSHIVTVSRLDRLINLLEIGLSMAPTTCKTCKVVLPSFYCRNDGWYPIHKRGHSARQVLSVFAFAPGAMRQQTCSSNATSVELRTLYQQEQLQTCNCFPTLFDFEDEDIDPCLVYACHRDLKRVDEVECKKYNDINYDKGQFITHLEDHRDQYLVDSLLQDLGSLLHRSQSLCAFKCARAMLSLFNDSDIMTFNPKNGYNNFLLPYLRHHLSFSDHNKYIAYSKWWSSAWMASALHNQFEVHPDWDLYAGFTGDVRRVIRRLIHNRRPTKRIFHFLCGVQQLKRAAQIVPESFTTVAFVKHAITMLKKPSSTFSTSRVYLSKTQRDKKGRVMTNTTAERITQLIRRCGHNNPVVKRLVERFMSHSLPSNERDYLSRFAQKIRHVLSNFSPELFRGYLPSTNACWEKSNKAGGQNQAILHALGYVDAPLVSHPFDISDIHYDDLVLNLRLEDYPSSIINVISSYIYDYSDLSVNKVAYGYYSYIADNLFDDQYWNIDHRTARQRVDRVNLIDNTGLEIYSSKITNTNRVLYLEHPSYPPIRYDVTVCGSCYNCLHDDITENEFCVHLSKRICIQPPSSCFISTRELKYNNKGLLMNGVNVYTRSRYLTTGFDSKNPYPNLSSSLLVSMDYHPNTGVVENYGFYPINLNDLKSLINNDKLNSTSTSNLHPYNDNYDEENDVLRCRVNMVPEPWKCRGVTCGPATPYFLAKSFQKSFHSYLKQFFQFSLIGQPLSKWHIDKLLELGPSGEGFISGDYSGATDNVDLRLTSVAHDIAMERVRLLNLPDQLKTDMVNVLNNTIKPHRVVYPKHKHQHYDGGGLYEHITSLEPELELSPDQICDLEEAPGKPPSVLQMNGQLMGSPTSFPYLCLINFCVSWEALYPYITDFRLVPILVNGDDLLAYTDSVGYRNWCSAVADAGFKLSIGKNYFHKNYLFINSQPYYYRPTNGNYYNFFNYKYCPSLFQKFGFKFYSSNLQKIDFFNQGLMNGQSKVGKVSNDPRYTINQPTYELQPEAVSGANKFENACKEFYWRHYKHIQSYSCNSYFNPWFPREYMGLSLLGNACNNTSKKIPRHQRKIATICRQSLRDGRSIERIENDDVIMKPVHKVIIAGNTNFIVTKSSVSTTYQPNPGHTIMTNYISTIRNDKEFDEDRGIFHERLNNHNLRHKFTRLLQKFTDKPMSVDNCLRGVTVQLFGPTIIAQSQLERRYGFKPENSSSKFKQDIRDIRKLRYDLKLDDNVCSGFSSINHPRYNRHVTAGHSKVKVSVHPDFRRLFIGGGNHTEYCTELLVENNDSKQIPFADDNWQGFAHFNDSDDDDYRDHLREEELLSYEPNREF